MIFIFSGHAGGHSEVAHCPFRSHSVHYLCDLIAVWLAPGLILHRSVDHRACPSHSSPAPLVNDTGSRLHTNLSHSLIHSLTLTHSTHTHAGFSRGQGDDSRPPSLTRYAGLIAVRYDYRSFVTQYQRLITAVPQYQGLITAG